MNTNPGSPFPQDLRKTAPAVSCRLAVHSYCLQQRALQASKKSTLVVEKHLKPISLLRQLGFSLIELTVVISIAAILLTVGAPNFQSLLNNQKMTSTVNDFFAAINLTRSEAIQRGRRVDLVPTDANDWSKGWVILIDENNNQKPDPGERIIFSHGPIDGGIQISAALTDSKIKYLAYNGTGRTHTNANHQTPQAGSFLFSMGEQKRKIVLNFLGRPRICNPVIEKSTC